MRHFIFTMCSFLLIKYICLHLQPLRFLFIQIPKPIREEKNQLLLVPVFRRCSSGIRCPRHLATSSVEHNVLPTVLL
jgi:hypothetical protein